MRLRQHGNNALAVFVVAIITSPVVLVPRRAGADDRAASGAPPAPTTHPADEIATAVPDVVHPRHRLLMRLLDETGLGESLDGANINVFGHLEGSYTANLTSPTRRILSGTDPNASPLRRINFGRFTDLEADRFLFNQFDLAFERRVDEAVYQQRADIGGRVELLYGSDARLFHATGLTDSYGPEARATGLHDTLFGTRNQFDLLQAYIDVAVPVGDGLRLRIGKFTSFLGGADRSTTTYETYLGGVDPTTSPLYSHTFLFATQTANGNPGGFRPRPLTHTGVLATYEFGDKLTVDAGISRGWDQSIIDLNSSPDFLGRLSYAIDDTTTAAVSLWLGPQRFQNNRDQRLLVDAYLRFDFDEATLFFDGDFGYQASSGFGKYDLRSGDPVTAGKSFVSGPVNYYALTAIGVKPLSNSISLLGRVEIFRDDQGFTTGVPATYYEATLGAALTPFDADPFWSQLTIRPEIRLDYSDQPVFADFRRHHQLTFALDFVVKF